MDRVVGWCVGILVAAIALYCAVRLVESIWPALLAIVGVGAIIAGIIRLVVYYTSKKSW
jgi:hypothetical protein